MRIGFLSLLLGGLFAFPTPASTRDAKSGLITRTVSVNNTSYDYQIYVPKKLAGKRNLPVLLFLHGIGQRGAGGFVPTGGATGALVQSYLERVPGIVLLPQCREGRFWSDPEMVRMTMNSLDQIVAEFNADTKRVYLIGVSMGGYGAWSMAAEHAGKFAAVVPICGGSPLRGADRFTSIARRIGRTPVWVFHGAEDRTVPVSESRGMVEALKTAGGNVRYSEYAGVGHNVYLKVLAERELLSWLFAQCL
jgi:predicted peptidase